MKLLKNRVFAIILCVAAVLGSTCISAAVRLNRQSDELIKLFYSGLNREESISSGLSRLCQTGNDICLIADSYGIDTSSVKSLSGQLQTMLSSESGDISDICQRYSAYSFELKKLREALLGTELTQRHIQMMDGCIKAMDDAEKAIAASSYNSKVTSLQKSFDSFPEVIFTSLFDIHTPAKFL